MSNRRNFIKKSGLASLGLFGIGMIKPGENEASNLSKENRKLAI